MIYRIGGENDDGVILYLRWKCLVPVKKLSLLIST